MINAQVVIVGGGIMGVSLLYHLSKAGWTDVVLLEKNDLTHGSTWHAAGLCTHFAHNATIQALRATSVRLYRDQLPSETGQSCGFHKCGAMRVTRNPDRMDEFAHVAGLSQFTGYELEVLTPERIAELHPLATLDGLLGGIYEPDDGHVDPSLATQALAQGATANGATIRRHTCVRAIRREDNHWLVTTDNDTYRTVHVVNAAGTWGWEVGQMMGVNVPSVPILHQYLVTDTVPEIARRIDNNLPELPIIRDPEESWYVRQERDGFILGPYERDAEPWSVDGVPPEFGADLLPPALDRVEPIIEAAMARIPAIASAGVKTVINGPITFSPDANPLIGPAHGVDNAWLLTGSSMGVMEGGGAGWFLAHWMTHGAPPMDALAVDSRRFGAWADRQYRLNKAVECFGLQFGVHYPYEERPAARNTRLSPLHDLMLERGAVMGVAYGRERPNWFSDKSGDVAEHSFRRTHWFDAVAHEVNHVSKRVSLADLSVLSKFSVAGPDADAFVKTLGANTAPSPGRINLTYALTPAGGVASEFSVAHISNTKEVPFYFLTSAAAAEQMDWDLLQAHAQQHDVQLVNHTDDWASIALMGPHATDAIAQLDGAGSLLVSDWLSAQTVTLNGIPTVALRVSYIGENGWELHVPADQAVALFQMLETAGKAFDVGYYGAFAANSMRLEKGYRAWGMDLTTERSPLESGLSRFVKLEKHKGKKQKDDTLSPDIRDFTGNVSMLERQRTSVWCMVLLEIKNDSTDPVDPFYAHPVFFNNDVAGIVTSGAYGHRIGKTLALAYLNNADIHQQVVSGKPIDGRLEISILGTRHDAVILDNVPYDPDNRLMQTHTKTESINDE